jgi:hypothetical protein
MMVSAEFMNNPDRLIFSKVHIKINIKKEFTDGKAQKDAVAAARKKIDMEILVT